MTEPGPPWTAGTDPPRGGRRGVWVGLAALVLVVAGGAVALERTGLLDADGPATVASPARPAPTVTAETLEQQIGRVARTVASIRGLDFHELPEPTYLSPDELATEVGGFVDEYTEEDAEADARILVALGAIPPGTDLRDLLRTALGEQVAGFYDTETERLVVGTRSAGQRLGPTDEVTLAHELEHALADQVLGLPEEEPRDGEEDASLARSALIEGDATLTMGLYVEEALSLVDRARLLGEQAELAEQLGDLTDLPHYLQRSLIFPYEEGLGFVATLHAQGGFAAVDDAYRQLPTTTLQIIAPERYLAGEGTATDARDVTDPGVDWERGATLAFGAADLLFLFEAPGDDPGQALADPVGGATAWRGGEITLFTRGADSAVGFSLVGEPPLCASVMTWAAATHGPGTGSQERIVIDGDPWDAVVRCDGREVRVGIAPDAGTADALTA